MDLLEKLEISKNKDKYDDSEELTKLIVKLHNAGASAFFDMAVSADQKDPDRNVVYVGQSGLGLPSKEYYEEEDIVNVYQDVIKNMFANVFDDQTSDVEATAKLIVEFEKKLAKVTVPS